MYQTCVYTYDPETEKGSLQSGFFQVRGPHVTFKWTRSISKQMPMVVFAKSVHVDSVPLQERKTVTAEWYIYQHLPAQGLRGLERVPSKHLHPRPAAPPRQRSYSARATAATRHYLQGNRVQLGTQTPYSTDLASCGFFLFHQVGSKMLQPSSWAWFLTYFSQRGLAPLSRSVKGWHSACVLRGYFETENRQKPGVGWTTQ